MAKKLYIKESEKTWNKIAKSFDKTRKTPWEEVINFIEEMPKESIAADVACGNGRHLIPCAKHCKEAIGLDISVELLQIVNKKLDKNNLNNTSLIHSDVVNIPLKEKSLDVVLYIAALHNIKGRNRRIQSLKEVKRVLKDEGRAYITVWSRLQDKFRKLFLKKMFTQIAKKEEFGDIYLKWKQNGLDVPRFYHLYSKREFIKDLKKANLDIINLKDLKICSKKHPDNYFALVK